VLAIVEQHEMEDARLNSVADHALTMLKAESLRVYPKKLTGDWLKLKQLLEAFNAVDMEAAERAYATASLLNIEKELSQ
jgi:hypothetical protein